MTAGENDDPRKLRAMVERVSELAERHQVGSVIVGLSAPEGDAFFPEFVEYLRSALRVEDGLHRMMRERAVVYLADVDAVKAREVLERLQTEFGNEVPATTPPAFEMRFLAVTPGMGELRVRDVLTGVFAAPTLH